MNYFVNFSVCEGLRLLKSFFVKNKSKIYFFKYFPAVAKKKRCFLLNNYLDTRNIDRDHTDIGIISWIQVR